MPRLQAQAAHRLDDQTRTSGRWPAIVLPQPVDVLVLARLVLMVKKASAKPSPAEVGTCSGCLSLVWLLDHISSSTFQPAW